MIAIIANTHGDAGADRGIDTALQPASAPVLKTLAPELLSNRAH